MQPGQAPVRLPFRKQEQPVEEMNPAWLQWFQNTQSQFNTYRKLVAPVVGASPFTFQFLGVAPPAQLGPCLAVVTGGTVSLVQISRDGTNFFTVGAATNMAVPLSVGDFIKITYTVAPTLTLFPQ